MTALVMLLAAVAGGVGAGARYVVDGLVRTAMGDRLPWGTMLINASGSVALGLITGLVGEPLPAWAVIAGTGFLGGYTTFSTASFETVRLLQQRRWAAAAVNGPGQLVVAIALAAAGLAVGRLI